MLTLATRFALSDLHYRDTMHSAMQGEAASPFIFARPGGGARAALVLFCGAEQAEQQAATRPAGRALTVAKSRQKCRDTHA